MTAALLLIDVQNAFFDGVDFPPIDHAERVLGNILALQAKARAAGAPVIYMRHTEPGSEFDPGSASWQLHPALAPAEGEIILDKTTPDSFFQTDLAQTLEKLGVTNLVIAGNQTEFCVDTTTRAAKSLGIPVTLAADAHGTFTNKTFTADQITAHHNRTLGYGFADVQPAGEIQF